METKITYNMKPKTEAELMALLDSEGEFTAEKEAALVEVIQRATKAKRTDVLAALIERVKKIAGPSKITLARLFQLLLTSVGQADDSERAIELQVSNQVLEWATKEKKEFLKTKLVVRVAEIYFIRGESRKAKDMIERVIGEAQAVDDKALLIEGELLEAKILATWEDWPKAKAALSSCRANCNKIYVAPQIQAEIESVSGQIHLAERDYTIASSYFIESLEGFHQQGESAKAARSFRHLLITKILMDKTGEAEQLVGGKHGEIYSRFDDTSCALLDILQATKEKSLVNLSKSLQQKETALKKDTVIYGQLEALYGQLLEKNILKLLLPYSQIELDRLTKKLQVNAEVVERKLCEMILDQKLKGSIDQDKGVLIILPDEPRGEVFESSLTIIKNLDAAVDVLFERSKKLEA